MAPAVQGPGGIALVDVNYIFKKHVRLKAQLKDLQAEAEKVQKDFERQLQDLQAGGQQLSQTEARHARLSAPGGEVGEPEGR